VTGIPDSAQGTIDVILSEDVRSTAKEVWLLDGGRFLVLERVHPAWMASLSWRRLMRQRRVLRMFVPSYELSRLPGLEASLAVAKRAFELCEAGRRYREWQIEVPVGDPAKHAAKGDGLMRVMMAHAELISDTVPESASPIRTMPYLPPPVTWAEPKPAPAAQGPKPDKKPKPDKAPRA
jgi:hypothetical protein